MAKPAAAVSRAAHKGRLMRHKVSSKPTSKT